MACKDKSKHNAYMRKYQVGRFKKKITEYKQYLGNACVNCGSLDSLHFDHINPETKLFEITTGWATRKTVVYEELDKCQLLCKDCHLKKSGEERTGELNTQSKLTEEDVRLIRELGFWYGSRKITQLLENKVSRTTVDLALRRKTWKHVE